jgi:8-oxo-dGTP pyrophosphatase MutT (NUDIX family)
VGRTRPGRGESVGLIGAVRAAGGVVWRTADSGVEVLLIHRPRYDDWSFPKGKAEAGESDEECALREVEEETSLRCTLGPELESTTYRDAKGRKKTVRYWAMECPDGEEPTAGDGVDDWSWLLPEEAEDRLSWPRDLPVLRSLPVQELV